MSQHEVINIIKTIKAIDEKKLIHKEYGEAAFNDFEPVWKEIKTKLDLIEKFNDRVDTETNNEVNSVLTNIYNQLKALVDSDKAQFVAQQSRN